MLGDYLMKNNDFSPDLRQYELIGNDFNVSGLSVFGSLSNSSSTCFFEYNA